MEIIGLVVIAIIAFMIKQITAAGERSKQSARSNQAQQGLAAPPPNQPSKQPGQLPARPVPSDQIGQYQVPGQVTGLLEALRSKGQFPPPGQHVPLPVSQFPQPGQYQRPAPYQQAAPFQQPAGFEQPGQPYPVPWLPAYQPPPPPPHVGRGLKQHRPPQNNLPAPKGDVDSRVRELMAAHNEVGAVRLLCDEQDMGIIEAQKYARSLVLPPGKTRRTEDSGTTDRPAAEAGPKEESRYVGSAAFAESVFSTDPDENVWASGWVDKPEQDDRTDMDELWQTVRNAGRPSPPDASGAA
jgi:hypothetical protein